MPAADWTSFWRKAKAAVDKDPDDRFGARLRAALSAAPRAQAHQTSRRFLRCRPSSRASRSRPICRRCVSSWPSTRPPRPRWPRASGRFVTRAVLDPEGDRVDRARGGLFFARAGFPIAQPNGPSCSSCSGSKACRSPISSGEDEQLALLEASHAAGEARRDHSRLSIAVLGGAGGRGLVPPAPRRSGPREMRRTLLLHGPRHPPRRSG